MRSFSMGRSSQYISILYQSLNILLKINIPKTIYESRHIDIKDSRDSSPEEKKASDDENSSNTDSEKEEVNEAQATNDSNTKCGEHGNPLSNLLSDFHFQERGLFQDINIYKLFRGQKLSMVWKLWELVLTNQP